MRLEAPVRDLALILDGDPFVLNIQNDTLKLRAGKLKADRNAANGFWGAWGSSSDDHLFLVESSRAIWKYAIYSILTPPDAYDKEKRYRHYLLSVGDALKLRADPDGHLWNRVPHAGAFGNAIEV